MAILKRFLGWVAVIGVPSFLGAFGLVTWMVWTHGIGVSALKPLVGQALVVNVTVVGFTLVAGGFALEAVRRFPKGLASKHLPVMLGCAIGWGVLGTVCDWTAQGLWRASSVGFDRVLLTLAGGWMLAVIFSATAMVALVLTAPL